MTIKIKCLRKIVFLTGDVHHPPDLIKRVYYRETSIPPDYELKASLLYAKVLNEYGTSCTLFVTGKVLDMFPEIVSEITELANVEIGAHTYYAFRGLSYGYTFLVPVYTKMFKTPYGPKLLIRHDVFRAIQAFKKLGLKVLSWRTHGYQGNEYLYRLLAKLSVKLVSDCRSNNLVYKTEYGIIHVCINMPVDDGISRLSWHERTKWYYKYLRILGLKAERGEPMVLQLHPINMMLDNFDFLLRVVETLKKMGYRFLKLSEILQFGVRS